MTAMRPALLLLCLAIAWAAVGCRIELDLGENDGAVTRDAAADATARSDDASPAVPTDALVPGDLGCPAGRLFCNGECVDPQSNQKNCGVCNLRCQIGQDICLFGKCSPCAAGLNCNNVCTKAYTDRNNCGACGVICTANQSCVNGNCVP